MNKLQNKMIADKTYRPPTETETSASIARKQTENLVPKETRDEIVTKINEAYSQITELEEQLKKADDIDKPAIERKIGALKGQIVEEYRPMAEARFTANLATAPSEVQKDNLISNKEDIVNDMLYDPGTEDAKSRSVLGMIDDFKIERHKYGNLAAYINTLFKRRSYEVFAKYDKGFETSLDAANKQVEQLETEDAIVEDTKRIQTGETILAEKIFNNDPNPTVKAKAEEHNNNILNQIEADPSLYEGKNYKQVADLDPRSTVEMMVGNPDAVYVDDGTPFWKTAKGKKLLGTPIVDSILNKLQNNDNLNSQDLKALQRFIRRHTMLNDNVLWKSLPEAFMTRMVKQKDGTEVARPDKATGVQNVLLEHFYNRSSKRIGNGYPQYKKPVTSITENDFMQVFGITPRGEIDIVGREQNVSQTVKALVSQVGKTMTNQSIRQHLETKGKAFDQTRLALENGKSEFMYSKVIRENMVKWPKLKESYANLIVSIAEDETINWGKYAPSKKFKIDDDLKNKIRQHVNANIPRELRSQVMNEFSKAAGGQLVQIASMKNNMSQKGSNYSTQQINEHITFQIIAKLDNGIMSQRSVQAVLNSDKAQSEIMMNPDNINAQRLAITDEVAMMALELGIKNKSDWTSKKHNTLSKKQIEAGETLTNVEKIVQHIVHGIGQYASMGKIGNSLISIQEEGGMAFLVVNPDPLIKKG